MSLELRDRITSFAPTKGGKGSICVIGGSIEYSGAPFFSAISALRTGVDLSFVICDKNAANVIKSYSPELIVFGLLDQNNDNTDLKLPVQITNRVSVFVIGPGLSRNANILEQVKNLLLDLKNTEIPIIFDGDGIFFFKNHFMMFKNNLKRIILTPNFNEFKLLQTMTIKNINGIIYAKGKEDLVIHEDKQYAVISELGAPRRCGGIGDILSGVIAALFSMCGNSDSLSFDEQIQCLALSGKIVRRATRLAFESKGRSMSALDIIWNIGSAFEQVLE